MDCETPETKRRFDITMSRRTRKPAASVMQAKEKVAVSVKDDPTKEVSLANLLQVKESDQNDHKSLKQLINGDGKKTLKKNEDVGKGGKSSLGQHFNEEKNLQIVRKQQQQDSLQGLKFKNLMRRYTKVLGHLMKAKRDTHIAESGKRHVFKIPK